MSHAVSFYCHRNLAILYTAICACTYMVSCCAKLYYYHIYELMINLVKILSNGSINFNCTAASFYVHCVNTIICILPVFKEWIIECAIFTLCAFWPFYFQFSILSIPKHIILLLQLASSTVAYVQVYKASCHLILCGTESFQADCQPNKTPRV